MYGEDVEFFDVVVSCYMLFCWWWFFFKCNFWSNVIVGICLKGKEIIIEFY